MTTRATGWMLFAAMACAVPLPFFALIAGGLLPVLFVALSALRSSDYAWWLFGGVHCVVYSPILFFASRRVATLLARQPEYQQRYLLATLVVALLLLGFVPMYGISHGSIQFRSAYSLYWLVLQKHGF